jgi:hypothetical protein
VEGEGAIDALEGTSLLSLCCSPDPHIVNIICNWQAVNCASELNMSVFGNHHVLQVPVQYLPSQEHRSFDYFPLTISADYNPNVYHDFQKKRIAVCIFSLPTPFFLFLPYFFYDTFFFISSFIFRPLPLKLLLAIKSPPKLRNHWENLSKLKML